MTIFKAIIIAIHFKGMKSVIATGGTSFILGGLSFAVAGSTILTDVAAVVGIMSGVATAFYMMNMARKVKNEARKVEIETDLIFERCNHCKSPELCVFEEDHRPETCPWKDDKDAFHKCPSPATSTPTPNTPNPTPTKESLTYEDD